jgi:hypothetical protein
VRRILAIAASTTAIAAAVHGAPLEKEACEQLRAERATIEKAGTRGHLAKGPEWAKANLAKERIDAVRRLIELDEQVAFRCGQPRSPLERVEEQAADPAPKKPRTRSAARQPAEAAPTGTSQSAAGEPQAAPPAASRRKAAAPAKNDAYVPPGKPPAEPPPAAQPEAPKPK